MLAPHRIFFFFADYLGLALILWANAFFWKKPDFVFFGAHLLMSFFLYFLALFIFSGSFMRIKQPRRPLSINLLALVKGVLSANVAILAMVFFFFKPHRNYLVYFTMINGAIALPTLWPGRQHCL